jgi:amidohydrolase
VTNLSELKGKVQAAIDEQLPSLLSLYKHFHAHPELSGQEVKTAARVAEELVNAGCQVTTGVGGHGVVGLLCNGAGPVLMLRADMDALPIKEQTGLPYASNETVDGPDGNPVAVMHACGHDLHTTNLIATARVLSQLRGHWGGTLMLVAQPAEEAIGGARLMIQDGLFTRFPRPDWALALHVDPAHPVGTVSIGAGYVTTSCQSLDVVFEGRSGHGASPHLGVDAIVLASQFVLALQTVVSRRTDPRETVVVHVGRIEGGTSRNTIADKVKLELSLRAQGQDSLERLVQDVTTTARGVAQAAGLTSEEMPSVKRAAVLTPSVKNNTSLSQRLAGIFREWLGPERVVESSRPLLGSEDFSRFGEGDPPVALSLFFLGATGPAILTDCEKAPKQLPRLHTPAFFPNVEASLPVAALCFCAASLSLLRANVR